MNPPPPPSHQANHNPRQSTASSVRRNVSDFVSSLFQYGSDGGLAAAVQESFEQAQGGAAPSSQTPPPASPATLRQLPLVTVSPEDLLEPCNRECCICLEAISLQDVVIRLPCSHLFHPNCVTHWLSETSGTCPVCRYELPCPEHPEYERLRKERMKDRKPRYAPHELERLSTKQLVELLPSPPPRGCVTKADLLHHVIQSGTIDVVAAPPPVQYSVGDLQQMSIRQLKRVMNDEAGVFFHAKDVVEKEDLLRIFINSGRLQVLPDEKEEPEIEEYMEESMEDRKPEATTSHTTTSVVVETVQEDSDDEHNDTQEDERIDATLVMEEDTRYRPPSRRKRQRPPVQRPQQEQVEDDAAFEIRPAAATATDTSSFSEPGATANGASSSFSEPAAATAADPSCPPPATATPTTTDPSCDSDPDTSSSSIPPPPPASSSSFDPHRSAYENYNIVQLQNLARARSVDLAGCLEKSEIVHRLASSHLGHPDLEEALSEWGVSELRALAALSEVDLSQCHSRQDMVLTIHRTAVHRPHVARYFQTLAPLAQLTTPQLRAVARERQIDVSDCLEKGDMIQRLVRQI